MTHKVGETLEHEGQAAIVVAVREEENEEQGRYYTYDLRTFSPAGATGDVTLPAVALDDAGDQAGGQDVAQGEGDLSEHGSQA